MLLRLIAYVAVFFFVYSVQFIGSPGGLGTRACLGAAGLILLIRQAAFLPHGTRPGPNIQKLGALLCLLAVLSLISLTFNSTFDMTFILYAPSMLIISLAAFLVAQVVKWAYPAAPISAGKRILIAVVTIQVFLALLMFLIPELGKKLNEIQIFNELDQGLLLEVAEFRLTGFGAKFFGAGIANCFALILIISMVRTENCSRNRIRFMGFEFFAITVFGMMLSRSTVLGAGLALAFLAVPLPRNGLFLAQFQKQRRDFALSLIYIPLCLFVTVIVVFPSILAQVEPAIKFGFDAFTNFFQTGRFEDESSSQLLDMYKYDPNLPLWIGDGLYMDPNSSGAYYKAIDVGFLRLIYYFGATGLLAYLAFQFQAIKMSGLHLGRSEGRKFLVACLLLLILLNFKGFADLYMFSIYLYMCTI